MTLATILQDIERYIAIPDTFESSISQASTYWHLMHSLSVINGVIDSLQSSDPQTFRGDVKLTRSIYFCLHRIPRGVAKTPPNQKEFGKITQQGLEILLHKVLEKLPILAALDSHAFFNHSRFGQMNLRQTTRFLVVHTHHHIKIIKDILKN